MANKGSITSKVISWIFTIIVIVVLIKTYKVYKKYYFGDFIKAENQMNVSKFYRNNQIKYSKSDSYEIQSPDYNDAVFYKEIQVKPNTPYRLTCMVKTENVVQENENTDAGAMLCLLETSEVSQNIVGTNEWQKLTFMFNSKNRETVKLACRLGGNSGNCKGTAWFSDFKLEEGMNNTANTEWKVACFIFKNITIPSENIDINMDLKDVENIKLNMQRFQRSCRDLSQNKMNVKYDIYEITEPITTVSYSEEHKYHISPQDVKNSISDIVLENEYDHIIAVVRMGDSKEGIEINNGDWIRLRRHGII